MKASYWLLTIPHHLFTPYLPAELNYIKGQLERGNETGYLHWQIIIGLRRQSRLATVKKIFGEGIHAEASRSAAANDYVWKEETAVPNTRFELGRRPLKRGDPKDWDEILSYAKRSEWDSIPSDVYIRNHCALRRIGVENASPVGVERSCTVFWGKSGTGKSRLAWEQAGLDAYPKDPNSKFWDGYRGQKHVVIDEFRGSISISHLLRWLDRYPVLVEVKGSSAVYSAEKIWITSNLHPRDWYPELDEETKNALLRRMVIVEFAI